MIICQTPFRVSFFGGGTDFPEWYEEHGGRVISTSIDRYCYISCRYLPPFFEHKYRIVYSCIEKIKNYDEIKHPAVKGVLSYLEQVKGVEIHYNADLPAHSGLASSSSFTVGLLHSLLALRGQRIEPKQLAQKAIYIEREIIQEVVGCQDQIAAAYGGFNLITFQKKNDHKVVPIIINKGRLNTLQERLVLYFTGFSRFSSEIEAVKVKKINANKNLLKTLQDMVDEAVSILSNPKISLDEFGKLLDEAWRCKKELSDKVSLPQIDQMYELAKSEGAKGGKLLGAGGGGFLLLYANVAAQVRIREKLKNYICVNFRFENEGSRIVLYKPDGF
jgi:D-glycero-alpha-D-manno-heptose-7-phosphate kinase